MICEKCGFKMSQPETVCPRCGDVLPKEIIVRATIEEGSIDSWAENSTDFKALEEEKQGLDAYLEQHPSAPFFFGALGFRSAFYLLALIATPFVNINLWHGWGLVVNCIFAAMACVLILLKLEDRDFYWGKTITSIIIFTDALITFGILVWPAFEWVVAVVTRTFV